VTKVQLATRLELIAKTMNDDPEKAHACADDALLDYVCGKRFRTSKHKYDRRIKAAWDSIKKHYA
jgi:hypothetical protein